MNRTIDRMKVIFVALFAVLSAGVFVYHIGWVWPGKRCEARGDWWDWRSRVCAHPILLSDITGRTIGDIEKEKAEKAAKAAATAAPKP
jgi:hypothetical protein